MDINRWNSAFHIHTYRCGHASEEREKEYIEKAVSLGVRELYFTDHAPFPGDMFRQRMKMTELSGYVETLKKLKEEYSDVIAIKTGLEIEYVPSFLSYYQELRSSGNFDVLLLGQHFSFLPEQGQYTFECKDKVLEAVALAQGMIEGIDTGLFEAVAHPDQIFRRGKGWNEEMEHWSERIKEAAVRNGVALEQNVSNILEKKVYRPEFWEKLPDGLQTIYGLDAHSVEELEKHYKWVASKRSAQ